MVDLEEFLRHAIQRPVLNSMVGQLLVCISVRLQLAVAKLRDPKAREPLVRGFSFKLSAAEDAPNGHKLDHKLAKYVHACKTAMSGATFFGVATDKGSVYALPLQITLLSLPTNMLTLCAPTVDQYTPTTPHRYRGKRLCITHVNLGGGT